MAKIADSTTDLSGKLNSIVSNSHSAGDTVQRQVAEIDQLLGKMAGLDHSVQTIRKLSRVYQHQH